MNTNNMLIFKAICQGIPYNKFTLDCLVDCEDEDKFDITDLYTFESAHPIVWAASTFQYPLDGEFNVIIFDFCRSVLHIRDRKILYLFNPVLYTGIDDRSAFLGRLNMLGGRGSRFHEEAFYASVHAS